MRTIAIINQKGGCGKTTSAINLAGALARLGQPTLLVDLDPQAHCAAGLAIPEERIDLTIADAMLCPADKDLDPSRLLWRVSKGLDLAPCTMRLAGLEAARGGLAELPDKESRLAHAIERLATRDNAHAYEWCIIDCPPSIGLLTFNALRAATETLIPVETGFFAYRGAGRQVNTIRALVKRIGEERPHRLIATMHDPSSAIANAMLAEIGRKFAEDLVPVVIRLDQRLREAASLGQPVVEHAPDSTGAEDHSRLAAWLIDNPPRRAHTLAHAIAGAEPGRSTAPASPDDAGTESLLTRAAELAARVRALSMRSEALQTRMAVEAEALARRVGAIDQRISGRAHSPDAGHGPVVTPEGVRFTLRAHPESRVAVAGAFNGWSPDATPLSFDPGTGEFVTVVPLEAGRHPYRFVLNGAWTTDPLNPDARDNGFGERDSVVTVRPLSPGLRAEVTVVADRPLPVLHN